MTARFNMQGNHRDSPSACIQMEGEGERGGKPGGSRGSERRRRRRKSSSAVKTAAEQSIKLLSTITACLTTA